METVTKTTSKRRKTFGQQERYEHVTKAIFNERLKCKEDTWLRNIDITTEESWLVKKGEAYHRKAYVPDLSQAAQRNIPRTWESESS